MPLFKQATSEVLNLYIQWFYCYTTSVMISTINQFLKETKQELDKVTWPTKEETVKLTQTVIIVTVTFALYLGALDYLFAEGLNLLILKN